MPRIKMGPIELSLSKARTNSAVSMKDIGQLNSDQIRYVESLDSTEIENRLRPVSLNQLNSQPLVEEARNILSEYGIVVIRNFAPPALCEKIKCKLDKFLEKYQGNTDAFREEADVAYQVGNARLYGYRALAEYGKTVINVRQGQDKGMIDIFNIDYAMPDTCNELRSRFEQESVRAVMGDRAVRPRNLNVYSNVGVMETRGFHVDSYRSQLKAFVYLTDVCQLSAGPYTYVKGSHVESAHRRANYELGKCVGSSTESPIVRSDDITPVLAGKGSLVISDQGGIHRGWPQAANGARMVAVMNYNR